MNAPWRIELFGWLRATHGDQVIQRFRMKKIGALLAYLAYHPYRSHPREALIELLWPECDPTAGRNRLSVSLSSLRRQLEPPGFPPGSVILADQGTVQLNPAAITTDVACFEAAFRAAERAASLTERVEQLARAIEFYRGELLPGYFEEWIVPERQRLAELFHQALRRLVALLERSGDLERALQWAQRAVSADPLREEAHRDLIRLLAATGEPAAALRQYDDLEQRLATELGAAPDPGSRSLAQRIRDRGRGSGSPASGGFTARQSTGPQGSAPPIAEPQGRGQAAPMVAAAVPGYTAPTPLPTGTVTFLLTEITESGPPGSMETVPAATFDRYHDLLRPLFRGHGGHEVSAQGPMLQVAFGRASDALAAAVAGQRALLSCPRPLADSGRRPEQAGNLGPEDNPGPLRMALHTGEVEPGEEAHASPALPHTARLLLAAHGGQVLVSERTAALLQGELAPGLQLTDLGLYRLHPVASPERLFQATVPDLTPGEFPPPNAAPAHTGSLPLQSTRFFGREAETARLQELLQAAASGREPHGDQSSHGPQTNLGATDTASSRLVTLMGPGGIGKTRLAIEAVARVWELFRGAVWFVPLQDLADPDLALDHVRRAMHLPRTPEPEPLEQIAAILECQASLLLLDNFEHLVTGAGTDAKGWSRSGTRLVQMLLERVPTLTVLVTSRQRLDLPGERVFPVLPLPVPVGAPPRRGGRGQWSVAGRSPEEGPSLATDYWSLITAPSVRLFVDRAQAVRPDFQVTAANAAAVAELCERLEGIPLALELAAARAGVLTPQQMLLHLRQRFQLLTRRRRESQGRHHSLRATLDWSYQLLSPELQRFFRQLSVFRGGWTLASAEVVCQEPAALEYLEQLRDGSLVLARPAGGEMRYELLEMLREYALEQLTPEERASVSRQHLEHYLALAEQAAPELLGASQAVWLDRLEGEHDNLRAALRSALQEGGIERGLKLAGALGRFWLVRGYLAEGREHLAMLLAHAAREGRPDAQPAGMLSARARASNVAGVLAQAQGDYQAARARFEESLAIQRGLEDRRAIAMLLNNLGVLAQHQGDDAAARSFHEESLALKRELEDRLGVATSLNNLGNLLLDQGDYAAARALHEESLAIRRELGDQWAIAASLNHLGSVAHYQGDDRSARAFHEEGLAIQREQGDRMGMALSLCYLGEVACCQGQHDLAGALYHESLEIRREVGEQQGIAACLEGLAVVSAAASPAGESARETWIKAARLLAATAAWREAVRSPLSPADRAEQERCVAVLRARLGEAAFLATWAEGQMMPLEEAVASALAETGNI